MTKRLDERFISYALKLAQKNLGGTAPNPVVGCVIVSDDGVIISSGITEIGGRPHAEKIAIDKISDKKILAGATLYVTLEPCSHLGQTPPCVDEIIQNKFRKVVIATQDPDSRVNGNGVAKLREAGIDVVLGVLEKEAQEINRGFFTAKKLGRPFVTLKLATSLDGKIATKNFDSKWITCERARDFSHFLRAKNDAILVGANTARKDNPSLDCRLSGLEKFSPRIVILSHENFNEELENILKKLCSEGVNSLLVEGGQNVATQFLQKNLVDELIWIRSNKIIGSDGISAIGKMNFDKISEVMNSFKRQEIREIDGDTIEIFRRQIN
ncbi:MAG: bifunctional diaminohydroxyphosphoribosylaminopyrimidine deaminase/5-amino-6-(5-phosphoribosylamino)uracil reductase RibD [Proteobacteria bacterium]|nr:bifunctional diaminohydroxyphosphoribosylaminopyrimidine deaminase/5-amino-6-(5-phosphoribosylamino)uracil reductase RibD [Pseudomonadota bacterium]